MRTLIKGISKKDLVLTAAGRRRKFLTGAGYGGVAEGVFVGDVEEIGTFGDLLGGPTAINREEDQNDPLRKLINRVKFGTEGALFTGVLGGIGLTAKKLADRSDKLRTSRSRIDKLLYNIAAGVRARGKLDPKSFEFERFQKPETMERFVEAGAQKKFLDKLVAADRLIDAQDNILYKYGKGDYFKEKDREKIGEVFDIPPGFKFAGGGIAKLAGVDEGPPPESGPNSQGLSGLLKRGNKI